MKNFFLFLILITLISSCCSNKDTIAYHFTNDEKMIIPYENQDIIKWKNNDGIVFSGTVLHKTTEVREISDYDCKSFEGENTEIKFDMDSNSYYVSLMKWDDSRLDLSVSKNIGQDNPITFDAPFFQKNNFGTVEFNGEVFENSIKMNGNLPNNALIYSKTNGIEFILFEDGTWYKRVE